jgi:hypothetical protein
MIAMMLDVTVCEVWNQIRLTIAPMMSITIKDGYQHSSEPGPVAKPNTNRNRDDSQEQRDDADDDNSDATDVRSQAGRPAEE